MDNSIGRVLRKALKIPELIEIEYEVEPDMVSKDKAVLNIENFRNSKVVQEELKAAQFLYKKN